MNSHKKARFRAQICAKTRTQAYLDAFMRNSLQTFALNREILYSHSLLKCAIAINLSQKIAKLQAIIPGAIGRFQTNIWPGKRTG
jgi:hypothetical protein